MYLALYRKYRPRTFDDVISQEHITTTLKNQLKSGQASHAYLFTGSRGTGKTTCAKILAKALNCTDLRDGNPCLECESCKSIDEDYSDITEIDAASNNSVDDVRVMKEESFYAPMSGKYKVYIIDEVHMLSIQAFNALLKLIEEPPAHVVFILATTEVHKVPATILSRCQRFEFRRIDIGDSKKRLLWVAKQEGKNLSDDAAFLISKISEGGMRDALSLLDQCFSVSDNVTADVVRECAGISGSDYLFRIADLIYNCSTGELLMLLDELISKSKDVTRLCEELISHFRGLMLTKAGADALAVRVTSEDFEKLKEQSDRYTLEQIMRCISILSETFSQMGRVRTPALLLEMCFIKLCTPKLDIDEKSLSTRIDRLEQLIENGASSRPIYYNGISENSAPVNPIQEPVSVSEPEPFGIELPEKLKEKEAKPDKDKKKDKPKENAHRSEPEDLRSAVFGNEPAPVPEPKKEKPVEFPAVELPHADETPEPESRPVQKQPDKAAPLAIWQDIISTLPISIQYSLENTTASISGNTVYISGGKLAVTMAVNDYREMIQKAASKAIGRSVGIAAAEDTESDAPVQQKTDKVSLFLDLARSKGIEIKKK
ncbi:MAG: DNA polymerase III subunit gamma/tau [Ruminiclostridium sp.]|nr:DNA polymerase III subunit gamma/tau [Ruminiclostridium sp.]